MANTTSPTLASLLGPEFYSNRCAESLRNVKNYIAGHELRKKQYVQAGLIPELADLLQRANAHSQGQNDGVDFDADGVWTQVANIVCVLAHGGPSFVHPILHCPLVSQLIARLPHDPSSKQALVVLNALNAIADNLPLSSPDSWDIDRRLAEQLYTRNHGTIFGRLMSLPQEKVVSQQIFESTAALICKTCLTEKHKATLVKEGVLTVLCGRLAAFVVAQGLVVPRQQLQLQFPGSNHISSPATLATQLSSTLETVAVLISSSKEFSLQFLTNSLMSEVLPNDVAELALPDERGNPWINSPLSATSTPIDLLLPNVPDNAKLNSRERSSFPPLGALVAATRKRNPPVRTGLPQASVMQMEDTSEEGQEYLIVPWLLYIVRTSRGRQRLVASHVLAILLSQGLVTATRVRTFGTLLIPVLIRMLEDQPRIGDDRDKLLTHMHYIKAVPAVLASLIMDNAEMQRIAFEAKAIPKLAVALRSTFEQSEEHETQLWSPTKSEDVHPSSSPAHQLGWGGPLLSARHIMTFREGLLKALAAIAPLHDSYRKEICDQGVLVQIMLALEPFQSQINKQQNHRHAIATSGNSTSTLLAACNTVRALTRSVTALRTRLVDADVGKAIMRLMYNSDPEVRIAATKVIANLAMDFSPLKATISEPDLIKKLCEQAHSANARLRLESIWALKLLVLNAPNKLKRDVIDELGSNWIKHLIETDPYDIPPGVVIGLSERDYPPRAVQETDSTSDDVLMDEDLDTESSMTGLPTDTFDLAKDYNKHTVEDDLAIQEQLIDLIRNLFCGETASEIVEYLLGEIGNDTFMKVLIERLKPRRITPSSKGPAVRSSMSRGIIVKVLYVIVHIAACAPNFRNMISANATLMRSVANFCSHDVPEIRVQCCWIIINLTYEDDSSDREACRLRALEVNKIGFLGHMRRLENDPEPNVRERAKTAVHLLEKMM